MAGVVYTRHTPLSALQNVHLHCTQNAKKITATTVNYPICHNANPYIPVYLPIQLTISPMSPRTLTSGSFTQTLSKTRAFLILTTINNKNISSNRSKRSEIHWKILLCDDSYFHRIFQEYLENSMRPSLRHHSTRSYQKNTRTLISVNGQQLYIGTHNLMPTNNLTNFRNQQITTVII